MAVKQVSGIRIKQLPLTKKKKKQNKDMILTASKSENQSELQHFADHKASVPQSPSLMPPDPSIQVPQDKT